MKKYINARAWAYYGDDDIDYGTEYSDTEVDSEDIFPREDLFLTNIKTIVKYDSITKSFEIISYDDSNVRITTSKDWVESDSLYIGWIPVKYKNSENGWDGKIDYFLDYNMSVDEIKKEFGGKLISDNEVINIITNDGLSTEQLDEICNTQGTSVITLQYIFTLWFNFSLEVTVADYFYQDGDYKDSEVYEIGGYSYYIDSDPNDGEIIETIIDLDTNETIYEH